LAICSAFPPTDPSIICAGSPGKMRIRKKTMVATPQITGMAISSRRTM
jgi:hypothetical protein